MSCLHARPPAPPALRRAPRLQSAPPAAAGEGVFDTIPIEADYTVGDMKAWLKFHKGKDASEYDLVGPKGVWKMGAGSEVRLDPAG